MLKALAERNEAREHVFHGIRMAKEKKNNKAAITLSDENPRQQTETVSGSRVI